MFKALFVLLSLTALIVPFLLFFFFFTYCFLLCVWAGCVQTHTHTPVDINIGVPTTTHRGGSLELATITVCTVAYSLCLTGHTTSALLLSPVHSLLHHLLSQSKHTQNVHGECVGRWLGDAGQSLSIPGFRKSHRVSVFFLLLKPTMLKSCQNLNVLCRENIVYTYT